MRPEEVRELFPSARDYLYLDAASLGPMARPVRMALEGYLQAMGADASNRFEGWYGEIEEARRLLAGLLGARPGEIALTHNTSEGVNLAASLVDWRKGDRVVVSEEDFPTNVYPFLNLRDRGVEVDYIGKPTPEAVEAALRDGTRMVSISSVNFRDGWRADVEGIGRVCREEGVLLHVDAAQSAGALETPLEWVDFMSAPGYKWLLSPLGTGFFYVREELIGDHPALGWRSVEEPMRFDTRNYRVRKTAARFELGNPNVPGVLGMKAALEMLTDVGPRRIEGHVLALAGAILDGLKEKGFRVISDFEEDRRSGIVSFTAPGITKERLAREGIVATVRDHVRLSPHVYNNEEDVERVLEALGSG
ncbi:MAG: aminotransferase class V-fold PLP-dependent enzyme [Euryarchaeota archaeon]|nr:aminotransferase class V-fold PLP-dependent enzyme [Euryarchaeota archaeon]